MSPSSDPRIGELTRLKLALATFALQLDAFELRAHGALSPTGQSGDDAVGRELRRGDTIVGQ
jgi:hypothetical protein